MNFIQKTPFKVYNYTNSPRPWDHFLVLGEIAFELKRYFVIEDTLVKERYIRELIVERTNKNDGLANGNLLASIADDKLWDKLVSIAKDSGLIPR